MSHRVAIYARYSTDLQSECSLEDQVRMCRQYAKRHGWKVTAVYQDAAVSGRILDRKGYMDLLCALDNNQFDIVLAEAIDRISRDQEDLHNLRKRLIYHSVELHTCDVGKASSLEFGLKGLIAEQYSEDLALKTHRGLVGRVLKGKSGGGRCYGYATVKGFIGDRKIVSDQAKVVRRIFEEYASGVPPKKIVWKLNEMGIPSPRGGTWISSTLVGNAAGGTGILNNMLYIGKLVWNRHHSLKDPVTRRKIYRLNPQSEWKHADVPHLRIVPQELWDRVQEMKKKLRSRMGGLAKRDGYRLLGRPKFVLSGLVKCGLCGGNYISHNKGMLRCSNHIQRNTCTNNVGVNRIDLENRVLDSLKQNLLQEKHFHNFMREFKVAVQELSAGMVDKKKAKEKQLSEVTKKIENIVRSVEDGNAYSSLVSRLGELEDKKEALWKEIAALSKKRPDFPLDMAATYSQKVFDLTDTLQGDNDDGGAREMVRDMIEQVTIHIGEGRDYKVHIRGNIAEAYKASEPQGFENAEEIKGWVQSVAGVGFEPTTFRL